jgi:hypothetical protein
VNIEFILIAIVLISFVPMALELRRAQRARSSRKRS